MDQHWGAGSSGVSFAREVENGIEKIILTEKIEEGKTLRCSYR